MKAVVTLIFSLYSLCIVACPEPSINPMDFNTFQESISWVGNESGSPVTRTGNIPQGGSNGATARFGNLNKVGTVPNILQSNVSGDATTSFNVFAGDIILISIVADGSQAANKAFFQVDGASKYEEFSLSTVNSFNIRCGMPKNLSSSTVKFKFSMQGNLGDYSNVVNIVINIVAQGASVPTTTYLQSVADFDKIIIVGEHSPIDGAEVRINKLSNSLIPELDATLGNVLQPSMGTFVKDAVIDGAGNIYAVGYDAASVNHTWRIAKFDRNLNLLWDATYASSNPGEYDEARSITITPQGSIWVLGVDTFSGSEMIMLKSIDQNGIETFSNLYSIPAGIDTIQAKRIISTSTDLIMAGTATNYSIPKIWGYVARFNHSGTLQVDGTVAGNLDTYIEDIALDSMGYLYAVGTTQNIVTLADVWIAQLDKTSMIKLNDATADYSISQDYGLGLDIYQDKLYIAGSYLNAGWWILKYDTLLNQLNTKVSMISSNEKAYSVRVDSNGTVNVTGEYEDAPTGYHGWRVAKFSSDLSLTLVDATLAIGTSSLDKPVTIRLFK